MIFNIPAFYSDLLMRLDDPFKKLQMLTKLMFATMLLLARPTGAMAQNDLIADRPELSDPSLAPTPPMGWNSWNWFGKNLISDSVVRQVVDAMDKDGLKDAGYNYVVVDGGWRDKTLGSKGELLADPVKFPHGMKALADYAHAHGLKFGLHTVPGTNDCHGDKVGGYGHEEIQIQQFIDWGLDFIKLDLCRFEGGWNEQLIKEVYSKWGRILKEKKSRIVLSISAYTFRDWNPQVGQMSRTTEDIAAIVAGLSGWKAQFDDTIPEKQNKWNLQTVMQAAETNNKSAKYAGHGYWNDPDMLVTGAQGLTAEEQRTHFALWCIMSAPLMLGDDPRNMTVDEKNIILNKIAIDIDQDPTEQGTRVYQKNGVEIWSKKLKGGNTAVLLLNRDKHTTQKVNFRFSKIGTSDNQNAKNVYSGEILGNYQSSFSTSLAPHSGKFLWLTPAGK